MSRRTRKQPAKAPQALLNNRINRERRQLQKASAVLICLIYAARHDAEFEGVQFGDAAAVAQELIDEVTALDPLHLERPASAEEVRS